MDIYMPDLDGYSTAGRIRVDHQNPNWNVLIVAYTADLGNPARGLARRAGMDELVSKSGSMADLVGTLKALFESGNPRRLNQTSEGFAGKTVLVADDDEYNRLITRGYLERCGANVLEAQHGHAVLSHLQTGTTLDAIVMDMNMPGLNGIETTALIRGRVDTYATVPIIALTGQSDSDTVQACLAAGMSEVMFKPVQLGTLYACVARHLARHKVLHTTRLPVRTLADRAHALVTPAVTPAAKPIPDQETTLLDEQRLEELLQLDLLDQSFLNSIEQMRSTVARLNVSVPARDLDATYDSLHSLLGMSGNLGAMALHHYTRKIYPLIVSGEWPSDAGWLTHISALSERSAIALEAYFEST